MLEVLFRAQAAPTIEKKFLEVFTKTKDVTQRCRVSTSERIPLGYSCGVSCIVC